MTWKHALFFESIFQVKRDNGKLLDICGKCTFTITLETIFACHHWVNFSNILRASFFVQKIHAHLFCTYILGLYFFGERVLVQKLLLKCWWNWHLATLIRQLLFCAFQMKTSKKGLRIDNKCLENWKKEWHSLFKLTFF